MHNVECIMFVLFHNLSKAHNAYDLIIVSKVPLIEVSGWKVCGLISKVNSWKELIF